MATFASTSLLNDGDFDMFVVKADSTGEWQWALKSSATTVEEFSHMTYSSGELYLAFGGSGSTGDGRISAVNGNWHALNLPDGNSAVSALISASSSLWLT